MKASCQFRSLSHKNFIKGSESIHPKKLIRKSRGISLNQQNYYYKKGLKEFSFDLKHY